MTQSLTTRQNDLVGPFSMEHLRFQTGVLVPNDYRLSNQPDLNWRHFIGGQQTIGGIAIKLETVRAEGMVEDKMDRSADNVEHIFICPGSVAVQRGPRRSKRRLLDRHSG